MADSDLQPPQSNGARDLTFTIGIMIVVALVFALWLRRSVAPTDLGLGVADTSFAGLPPGVVAPAITGEGWINGPPPADEFTGKIVVVDAWATWCYYCRQEVPMLKSVYERYKGQGVMFVGFTSEGSNQLAEIDDYVNGQGIPWPNAYGARETMMAYNPEAIPAYWVIGADGVIVWNRASNGSLEDGIQLALTRRDSAPSIPSESKSPEQLDTRR